MVIVLTKPGNIPPVPHFVHICRNCSAEFEFDETDARKNYSATFKEDVVTVPCPTCFRDCTEPMSNKKN